MLIQNAVVAHQIFMALKNTPLLLPSYFLRLKGISFGAKHCMSKTFNEKAARVIYKGEK